LLNKKRFEATTTLHEYGSLARLVIWPSLAKVRQVNKNPRPYSQIFRASLKRSVLWDWNSNKASIVRMTAHFQYCLLQGIVYTTIISDTNQSHLFHTAVFLDLNMPFDLRTHRGISPFHLLVNLFE